MRVETGSDMSVEAPQDEKVLPIKDLLQVIRRRLSVIVLVTAVVLGSAIGIAFLQTPTYEASIKLLVGQEQSTAPNNLGGEVQALQQLTQTLAEAVKTRPVAEAVIQRLDLRMLPEDFIKNLSVEEVSRTQFIEVSYEDPSPERAQLIANTVGDEFSKQVSEVNPSGNAVTATVWEEASVPDSPANPKPLRDGAVALVLGIMLGTGLAFLLEHLDDRWRSPEEVEQISGVPAFGVIPQFKVPKKASKKGGALDGFPAEEAIAERERNGDYLSEGLITVLDPAGVASEAYRTLRTSLLYTLVDAPPKVVMVTSSGPMEGKSITCANLGVVLAQAGKNTLILDCDLRQPTIHKIFGLRNLYGVVNVLAGERNLSEVRHETPLAGLEIVTMGPLVPNPAELLSSKRFAELVGSVRQAYDYVLIDTPPMELVSDPAILATQGDGVLLVLDAQSTRKGSVRRALRSLEAVGGNVLGMVMNNVKPSKDGNYNYANAYYQ